MPKYHFHVSGSVTAEDSKGREISSPFDLRREALGVAALASAHHASKDEEANVLVVVQDATGAICLKVRLFSQIEPI